MSKKRKSKANSIADLHFVSSLQLEQSLQLISELADDQHHVTVTTVDENQVQFDIEYLENSQRLARIKGTLQRWQGTETKLDADGSVERLSKNNLGDYVKSAGTFMVAGITGMSIGAAIGLPLELITVSMIGGFAYYARAKSFEFSEPQIVLFRHRDYLLQMLIDTFRKYGTVEPI